MKTWTALSMAVLMAVFLIACGGSSDSDSGSSESESSGTNQQAELRECLEKQGVELPEGAGTGQGNGPPGGGQPPADGEFPPLGEGPPGGQGGAPGMDNEELRKALEECGGSPPEGRQRNFDSGQFRERIQDYVRCVRRNGYDLPNANLSGEGPVFDADEVDQDDPDFQKASKECQDLLQPEGADAPSENSGS